MKLHFLFIIFSGKQAKQQIVSPVTKKLKI